MEELGARNIVGEPITSRGSVFTSFVRELDFAKGISFRSYEHEQLVKTLADYICSLFPPVVFGTYTFRWRASLRSAGRVFTRFVDGGFPSVSYFYVVELHPGGHGGHVHATFDSLTLPRVGMSREWGRRYGRNEVELSNSFRNVTEYAAKVCYMLKQDNCWWNFHLSAARYHKALKAPPLFFQPPPVTEAEETQRGAVLQGRTELFPLAQRQ